MLSAPACDRDVAGVILVYDLTNRQTLARLPKWAKEITQYGSFVAPLAEEVALRNIGGLPVPVLVRAWSTAVAALEVV
jgi:hypothetical protein